MMEANHESLQEFIWRTRYRDVSARPAEVGVADTWRRVAASVAAVEREPGVWRDRFLHWLEGYRFLPGGRILAGAGTTRQVTLFNCFVMGLIDDSLEGIFESLKEGALTMQQGGGVGYDFSTLRPRGARARRTGVIASGPVSFMHVWDAMCATILSTGARRGAMMATLRCDHPDIEEFIDAKRDSRALRHFNLSVLVSDEFLRAVEADSEWPLVFPEGQLEPAASLAAHIVRPWSASPAPLPCRIWKRVRARELWNRLGRAAGASAEPGVLFIDRINEANNLGYCESLSATNPCAEEPLPPYGACNLGSLNLAAFVLEPFTAGARLDSQGLGAAARIAARFLDDVIEISRFPLLRQREQVHRSRRVGLGITGLADALAMLGLRYEGAAARATAAAAMREIRDAAYSASVELARERGPFPEFRAEAYLERPFVRHLPQEIRAGIARDGIRNSHLLAIAPAGTISLLAGNLSSGIEPIFGLQTFREVLDSDGIRRKFAVQDYAYAQWLGDRAHGPAVPEWFTDRQAISARDELLMQASLQPYVDGAISKTVALAPDFPADEVGEIFTTAYSLGLKGCTVFRQAAGRGVIRQSPAEQTAALEEPHCCALERECD